MHRARGLHDLLRDERPAGERDRRLTDRAVAGLRGAGALRGWVPESFGGAGLDLAGMVQLVREVTRADPAAGWLVMILGVGDWLTAQFDVRAQREVFATGPDTSTCQVLTPKGSSTRTGGGWLVSGSWAPASGCRHARWAMLGTRQPDGSSALVLVPTDELVITDTWHVLGMRATGSELLSGRELFVPDHRVLARAPLTRGDFPTEHTHPRYRMALVPALATLLTAPMLSMAEAALEHVLDRAGSRGVPFTSRARQQDSPAFQLAVAEAAAKTDAARVAADDAVRVLQQHAADGTHPDPVLRTRLRMRAVHAVRQCHRALDELITAHGAGSLAETSPLHGLLRDAQTAGRHALIDPATSAELFGRILLDLDPEITEML
ncbi:acyl-CoA dehydrogenase [Saccharopolyspora sp. HNM0983]|uniref:Acyl-CoA dehydrogenase n=1 Tax=Saccharopolyspora montiporae TaxID=2781240 RepID=A0A929G1G6_9PSEU|nr:acyl-CoA dehydrogenase [Saccharopolyspora sp. HNM0983]